MAAVSVLEALLLIGIGVGAFMIYRRTMQLVEDLELRQIAPIREKLDDILSDVKTVTARVNQQAERFDHAVSGRFTAWTKPPIVSRGQCARRSVRLWGWCAGCAR